MIVSVFGFGAGCASSGIPTFPGVTVRVQHSDEADPSCASDTVLVDSANAPLSGAQNGECVFSLTLARDQTTLKIRVSKPGYTAVDTTVAMDQPQKTVSVKLERVK